MDLLLLLHDRFCAVRFVSEPHPHTGHLDQSETELLV
jgi:hypothetical protein